ncbi:MAG: hypothetical protein M3Q14_02820 [bacterium]|nr:hypothetical protein [bacterium]
MDSRIVQSFIAGVLLTLLSLVMLGFNLSTGGTLKINDDVNRYFDTCVGEGLIESTPRIQSDERGFPLAYYTNTHVPICENFVELKKTSFTTVDYGSLGANILFWTCLTFMILRKFAHRRTHG